MRRSIAVLGLFVAILSAAPTSAQVRLEGFVNSASVADAALPSATLTAGITTGDVTIPVSTVANLPSAATQFRIRIANELMLVTSVAGLNLTVTRGVESTTAAAHGINSPVYVVLTAASLLRNPRAMTASGDLEYLDATGAPARLAAGTDAQYLGWSSGVPIARSRVIDVNVKDLGAVGDGVHDDTSAITAAQQALPTGGGVIYFPPGTYLVSGTGIVLQHSNAIFRGAGMFASTVTMATGSIMQTDTLYQVSNIAVEDLGFDGRLTATNGITIGRYAVFDQFRVSRCRFWRMVNAGLALDGDAEVTVEDSLFHHPGDGKSAGITITNTDNVINIRRNKFKWLSDGISIDTGSTTSQVENPTEYVTIEGNYFDLGWWLLTARATGSGAGVTYSSTVLTDTGAAFSGLGLNDTVRVMPVKQTGTGTVNRKKITDASATFTTNSVRRGDIVRLGTAFAVVMAVTSQTVLTVEDWLSDTDRQPIASPATGSYTIYGVYIGKRSSFTGTTITTPRFHDFDGTAVTPANGTLYEVLGTRPNYPLQVEYSGRKIRVINNTFRRGWSDQISIFGYEAQIIGNTIEDGQDMGITSHGQGNVIQGNTIRHQGAGGIFTTASESVITGNVFSDTPWENATNILYLSHIIVSNGVQNGSRNIIANNRGLAGTVATPRYGISIYGASGNAVDANLVHDNYFTGHTTADILVRGAVATNTRLFDNTAALVVVDTSATLSAQRGSYGVAAISAGCGTGATVTGNDMAGAVTTNATALATCTVTFRAAMNAAQVCTANNQTSAQLLRVVSPSASGFTFAGTIVGGDVLGWHCVAP